MSFKIGGHRCKSLFRNEPYAIKNEPISQSLSRKEPIRNATWRKILGVGTSLSSETKSKECPENTETDQVEEGESSEIRPEEITEILITINEDLKEARTANDNKSVSTESCTIGRVPNNLRVVHANDVFDPKFVSIGPLHHGKPHLKYMEEHKLRLFKRLLGSKTDGHQQNEPSNKNCTDDVGDAEKLEKLAVAMKRLEVAARGCYSMKFDIDSSKFIWMLILDGCFVVELMRLFAMSESEHVDDPIFSTRWMVPNLQHDLLLLENQLPFSVLNKIFEITRSNKDAHSLEELAVKFFDPLMRCQKIMKRWPLSGKKQDHLLGLFRNSFLEFDGRRNDRKTSSSVQRKDEQKDELKVINCVRELQEAGIKLKKAGQRDLLDIDFNDGILRIPHLCIDDHTGSVFLNLLAYEQCNRYLKPYFTHYVFFFDSLINSSKDVEILHYKGIISHSLGSDEEVADLFNKLCKEVVHDVNKCYLFKELTDINEYYSTKWHRWRAQLRHTYFINPWAVLSLFAVILLLFLTAVQTVFSIVSYALPRSN